MSVRAPSLFLAVLVARCSGVAPPAPEPCNDETSFWVDATYDGVRSANCSGGTVMSVEVDTHWSEPTYPPIAFYARPAEPMPFPHRVVGIGAQNVPLEGGASGVVSAGRASLPEEVFLTVQLQNPSMTLEDLVPESGTWTMLEAGAYGEHFTLELRDIVFRPWDGHTLTYHRVLVRGFLPAAPIERDPCGFCTDAAVPDAGT